MVVEEVANSRLIRMCSKELRNSPSESGISQEALPKGSMYSMTDISEMMILNANREYVISSDICCRGPKGN